jgi:hypothetical protein
MMCRRQIAGSECRKNQFLVKNHCQLSGIGSLIQRVELKLAEPKEGAFWRPVGAGRGILFLGPDRDRAINEL